jgi:hypothetical protein
MPKSSLPKEGVFLGAANYPPSYEQLKDVTVSYKDLPHPEKYEPKKSFWKKLINFFTHG